MQSVVTRCLQIIYRELSACGGFEDLGGNVRSFAGFVHGNILAHFLNRRLVISDAAMMARRWQSQKDLPITAT